MYCKECNVNKINNFIVCVKEKSFEVISTVHLFCIALNLYLITKFLLNRYLFKYYRIVNSVMIFIE